MSLISAEEGALRRGAEAVEGANGDIVASIARIRGLLDDISAIWTSDAASKYRTMGETWKTDAERLNAVLVTLAEGLRGTESDQIATEDSHAATISGLSNMMGAQ